MYSISLLPEEDSMDEECASPLAVLSVLGVEDPIKDQMFSNTQLDCEDLVDFQVESLDTYSPCIVDVDIEKDNHGMPISNYEKHGSSEGLLSVSEICLIFSVLRRKNIIFLLFVGT